MERVAGGPKAPKGWEASSNPCLFAYSRSGGIETFSSAKGMGESERVACSWA